MCSPSTVEPVVSPVLKGAEKVWGGIKHVGSELVDTFDNKDEGKSGFTNVGPEKQGEPPKAPQLDPEQMAKIRAAGDDERRRALLRIGRASTKKTGSLGLPGDPFTATRKLLGG